MFGHLHHKGESEIAICSYHNLTDDFLMINKKVELRNWELS